MFYDSLGVAGYFLFFIVVVLGLAAGLLLMTGGPGSRTLGLTASVLNLPTIPFGTAVGIIGLSVLLRERQLT
jgi:hypothetical protein